MQIKNPPTCHSMCDAASGPNFERRVKFDSNRSRARLRDDKKLVYQQAEKNNDLSAEMAKAEEQQRQLAVRVRGLEEDIQKLSVEVSNAKGWALHCQGKLIEFQHLQRARGEVRAPVDEEVDILGPPPTGN